MQAQGPKILQTFLLEAESAMNACYQLKLLRLQEGFVVEKLSGRKGHLGDRRAWFFWDQSEAEQAFERIVLKKTSPGRKRVYQVLQPRD